MYVGLVGEIYFTDPNLRRQAVLLNQCLAGMSILQKNGEGREVRKRLSVEQWVSKTRLIFRGFRVKNCNG
jgi:hypothetical protein